MRDTLAGMDDATKDFLLWGCFIFSGVQALGVILSFFGITWNSLWGDSVKPAPNAHRVPPLLVTGCLSSAAAGFCLLLYGKDNPLWMAGIISIAAILIVFVWKSHTEPQTSSGQWKPKWQKLQWCNAERERLEKELGKFKATQEAFTNPKWEIVDDHDFTNATVELDGKRFLRCKFRNVTLIFRGTAPVEFAFGNEFSGLLNLRSDHPAARLFTDLSNSFRQMGSGAGTQVIESIVDSRGKTLSSNFVVGAEQEKIESVAQPKPSQYPIPQLRLEILTIISELEGFLSQFGEEPEILNIDQMYAVIIPRRTRVLAEYRTRFGNRISVLRDEIARRTGITDLGLDTAIQSIAQTSSNDAPLINKIVATLGEIALKVNA